MEAGMHLCPEYGDGVVLSEAEESQLLADPSTARQALSRPLDPKGGL
jgi:hypothetical protein